MPFIKDTTIDQVRELSLADVIGKFVDLKKHGVNYSGCCPFHDENTPSFNVNEAKNLYKCFGCGKGGNSPIKFYQDYKKVDWLEAVKDLAGMFNILIEYEEGEAAEKRMAVQKVKESLLDVNLVALDYFMQAPLSEKHIRCSPELAREWEIGFAPDGWDGLKNFLNAKGDYTSLAVAADLIKNNGTKVYDTFRNRVMFSIRDHRGRLVGFSGRAVGEITDKNKKYVNTSETTIYKKGELMFGLWQAREKIIESGEATLVEGNWDVIRMHERSINNTVAACGTALTKEQLALLAKSAKAKKLLLIYDGDKAGKAAAAKNAMLAMELGYVVDLVVLPEKEDPDSFFGKAEFTNELVWQYLKDNRKNYIIHFAEQVQSTEDANLKSKQVQELCQMIAYIHDVFLRDHLIELVVDMTGVKKSTLNKTVGALSREHLRNDAENIIWGNNDGENYTLPKGLTLKWREIRDEVLKYAHFTHENMIYMRRGEDPYTFSSVSNFKIRIIQHMEDEKRPMRLVEIQNIHGRKRTFDTPSDDFVTEMSFRKMLEGKGNYDWKATGMDFSRLCSKLKDDMGDGRMITILGWQTEGFWCFNNAVIIDGRIKLLDANGCFDYAGESFYIPSGNKIYERNESKFVQQKRALLLQTNNSFEAVARQIKEVHRNHAINALLFMIATCFSDLIYNRVGFFPIMFLYGEPGSGKDNLIHAIQSFFGHPQTAITITGKANTDKAKVRKFAQFINMIGHMSEYANGDEAIDQMIKSFWDRVGYERGNIDSSVGTDSVQITMSLIFTGNDYPTNDALITRFVGEEMNVTEFSAEQKKNYELLKEMTIEGYSCLLSDILCFRKVVEQDFRKHFKEVGAELTTELWDLGLADRMIQNAAVLGACFKIFENKLKFPFTWKEFVDNIKKVYQRQSNKRSTGSVVAHWWECIIECVKDQREPLVQGREFKLDGSEIVLMFSQVYPRYLKMHYLIYKKQGQSKMVLLDKLKKSDCYVEDVNSVRYSESVKNSGIKFDLEKANVLDDFLAALDAANTFRRVPNTPASSPPMTFESTPDRTFEPKNTENMGLAY